MREYRIIWLSTANTLEKTIYKTDKVSNQSLVDYLKDEEDQGAIIICVEIVLGEKYGYHSNEVR